MAVFSGLRWGGADQCLEPAEVACDFPGEEDILYLGAGACVVDDFVAAFGCAGGIGYDSYVRSSVGESPDDDVAGEIIGSDSC